MNPLSYFSFQSVLHNWCNKGCGMCYLVCGIVNIKKEKKDRPPVGIELRLTVYQAGWFTQLSHDCTFNNSCRASHPLLSTIPSPQCVFVHDTPQKFMFSKCQTLMTSHRNILQHISTYGLPKKKRKEKKRKKNSQPPPRIFLKQ